MSFMISQSLLPEFDHETKITRKTLAAVPEDKPDYRPHPKSMTLSRLAGHVAEVPMWLMATISNDALDLAAGQYQPVVMTSREALLKVWDEGVAAARATLEKASDEDLMKSWSLKSGDMVHFTLPKIAVIRANVMNHLIHHRAQLGVYLRLLDVPVPAVYGPSADDKGGM